MRKQVFGRKFKRDTNERKALFNGLISSMILRGSIKTTEQKAKAIKGDLDKLITKSKKDSVNAKRLLKGSLKPFEIEKLMTEIAPRFKDRNGGYTRIIRTGKRFNDNASMVVMQWTEMETISNKAIEAPVKKDDKPAKVSASKEKSVRSVKKAPKAKVKTKGGSK